MNNISCDVIKDLLPLYVDNICSEKTKDLIEKHLADCEECQQYYEALTSDVPAVKIPVTKGDKTDFLDNFYIDTSGLEKISKKIMTDKILVGVGVFAAVFMFFVMLQSALGPDYSIKHALFEKTLDMEDIRITELYELDNGNIYITMETDKKISWPYQTTAVRDNDSDDGTDFYGVAELTYSWWADYIEECGTLQKVSFVFPRTTSEVPYYPSYGSDVLDISEIYYKGHKNELTPLWTENQDIEKAPNDIEKKVAEKSADYHVTPYDGFTIFYYIE